MKKLLLLLVLIGGLISCEKEVEVEKIVYVDKIVEVKVEVEKIVEVINTIDNTDYATIDELRSDIVNLSLNIRDLRILAASLEESNSSITAQLDDLPSEAELEAYALLVGFNKSFYQSLDFNSRFPILNRVYRNHCTNGVCLGDVNSGSNIFGVQPNWHPDNPNEIFLVNISQPNTSIRWTIYINNQPDDRENVISASNKYKLALEVINVLKKY